MIQELEFQCNRHWNTGLQNFQIGNLYYHFVSCSHLCFDSRYFTSIPLPTDPAKLPRPAPKRESHNPRTSDLNDGPVVLSPKRKARRVMSDREGFDGNSFQVDKVDERGGEIRWAAGDNSGRNEPVLMSVDFSVFGSKPVSRPTINR